MTQLELKKGTRFLFDNERHQTSIGKDDIRCAEVFFEESKTQSWVTGFKIMFNGALIHSSKTFWPLKKRLDRLVNDWELDFKAHIKAE